MPRSTRVNRIFQENPGFSGFSGFRVDHRLRLVAFTFEICIGGFNGHPGTKLAKWKIDNTIFEQKREETKSAVYSKSPKTLGGTAPQERRG